MSTQTTPDTSELTRYIFHSRPRCPACESPNLKTLRSTSQSDGSTTRRTLCRQCGHRFFIILE